MLCAVRGAVTVEENQAPLIQAAVASLIEALLIRNAIHPQQIISVFFTVTPDLTVLNPARAVRQSRDDWAAVPMMCSQEPVIDGMLPRCVRVLIQYEAPEGGSPPKAVYLGEAQTLRPDLGG